MSETTLQKIPCPYFLCRSPNSWGFLSLAFLQTFPSLANSYLCFLSSPFLLFLYRKSHRELAVWESPLRGQRKWENELEVAEPYLVVSIRTAFWCACPLQRRWCLLHSINEGTWSHSFKWDDWSLPFLWSNAVAHRSWTGTFKILALACISHGIFSAKLISI